MFEWCTHFFLVLASTCRSRSRRSSSGDLTFSLQGCHRVHAKSAPMIRMALWYSAEILCEMMWSVLFNQLTKMMSFFWGGNRIATTSLGPQIFDIRAWIANMKSESVQQTHWKNMLYLKHASKNRHCAKQVSIPWALKCIRRECLKCLATMWLLVYVPGRDPQRLKE